LRQLAQPSSLAQIASLVREGDSLKDAIANFHKADVAGRDPGERTLALRKLLGRFVDVCNAVAYAHSRGVLHRELKPGNVMLGKYGETLVVDWGLAKVMGKADLETSESVLRPSLIGDSSMTQTGAAMGTLPYMSPEQASGQLDMLGPASDVYSLGATLYCLLTGKVPFEGGQARLVIQRVRRGEFPPPRQLKSAVPPALEAVCLKAMALRPEERYSSVRTLADDVEKWLADEPVTAYRDSAGERLARWGRRQRQGSGPTPATALKAETVNGSGSSLRVVQSWSIAFGSRWRGRVPVKKSTVSFATLQDVLLQFGFVRKRIGGPQVVFEHIPSDTFPRQAQGPPS
jgi:serine/threonine protein kinase